MQRPLNAANEDGGFDVDDETVPEEVTPAESFSSKDLSRMLRDIEGTRGNTFRPDSDSEWRGAICQCSLGFESYTMRRRQRRSNYSG